MLWIAITIRPTDASFRINLSAFARRSLRTPCSLYSFVASILICAVDIVAGGDVVCVDWLEDVDRFCLWLIVWLVAFDWTVSAVPAACIDAMDAMSNELDDGSIRFSCDNTAVGWIDSVAFDKVSLLIGLFVGIWSAVLSLVVFINPKCIDCCLKFQRAKQREMGNTCRWWFPNEQSLT